MPKYAPIRIEYDKSRLHKEIIESGIFQNGMIATSHIADGNNPLDNGIDGNNPWDNGINFKSPKFKNQDKVPLWNNRDHNYIVERGINTFKQVNVTSHCEHNQIDEVWIHNERVQHKVSKWVQYHRPWSYRTDYDLPYLRSVVEQFNLEFVSMIRIIYQNPPSIGLIHVDNVKSINEWYYNNQGVTITLNVSSGGANLYFLQDDKEITIDESNISCWHFDDSVLHCTDEVSSERIQIRIYGKHNNYLNLMDLSHAIY